MKKFMSLPILIVIGVAFCLGGCSDDDDDDTLYDLRILNSKIEFFYNAARDTGLTVDLDQRRLDHQSPGSCLKEQRIIRKLRTVAPHFLKMNQGPDRARGSNDSEGYNHVYTYPNGHLYWGNATAYDNGDNSVLGTATQTLDSDHFPTGGTWYLANGNLDYTFNVSYYKNLYMKDTQVNYDEDGLKYNEYTYSRDENGKDTAYTSWYKYTYGSGNSYEFQYKYRSWMQNNALRNCYMPREYEYDYYWVNGELQYAWEGTFDANGYPVSAKYDYNGDGTYEYHYSYQVVEDANGNIESFLCYNSDSDDLYYKYMYTYDAEGLISTEKYYYQGDELMFSNTYTWHRNPVAGPSGDRVMIDTTWSDGDYDQNVLQWTETMYSHDYYYNDTLEYRETATLEKVAL
ncbi:hypothetical protein ACFL27_13440 [candidate division CSSED10-310 bacterium]|uniref:DUF4595 domain-containing protein n=1 Tax=candidate division CSSED10-310 bacterium TaxID=2855610 RepID=A0ABV6YYC2_UNCC1